jgi:hypothetical protein
MVPRVLFATLYPSSHVYSHVLSTFPLHPVPFLLLYGIVAACVHFLGAQIAVCSNPPFALHSIWPGSFDFWSSYPLSHVYLHLSPVFPVQLLSAAWLLCGTARGKQGFAVHVLSQLPSLQEIFVFADVYPLLHMQLAPYASGSLLCGHGSLSHNSPV